MEKEKPDPLGGSLNEAKASAPPLGKSIKNPMLARSLSLNSPHIAQREAEYVAPLSVGRGLDFHLPRRQGRPPPVTTLSSSEPTPGPDNGTGHILKKTRSGHGHGAKGDSHGAALGQSLLTLARAPTPPLTPRSPRGGKGQDQTFSTFRKHYPPYNDWGMPIQHKWRLRAVVLVDSVVWDACIFVMIMMNSMCLAAWRPGDGSYWALTLRFLEVFFQICFTYEAIIKIFALGVVGHRLSYLRDPWNAFDFIILISGWIALNDVTDQSSVFSVLRVLRPLRILRMFPELRRLTGAVSMAVPQLINLASLGFLIFVVLGVVGVDVLGGKLRHRCYKPLGKFWEDYGDVLMLCSTSESFGRQCPSGYECVDYGASPNYDITKFDSFPYAFLTIFQCMTQQGWSDVMYWSRQAMGSWTYAYFLLMIFCSFFLFNLIIVVIIVDYSRSQEQSAIESIKDGRMTDSIGPDGKLVVKPSAHPSITSATTALRMASTASSSSGSQRSLHAAGWAASGRPPPLGMLKSHSSGSSAPFGSSGGTHKFVALSSSGPVVCTPLSSDYSELLVCKLIAIKAAAKLEMLTSNPPTAEQLQGRDVATVTGSKIAEVALLLQRSLKHLQNAPQNNLDPELFAAIHKAMRSRPAEVSFESAPMQYICIMLVQSPHFDYFGHLMTAMSTILLCFASYDQDRAISDTLSRLNAILILIFTLESYVKIRGLGWNRFKADGMNTFDLIVAILSLMELVLAGQSTRLYTLRCVRLLRIFSLARSWKAFRRVLTNMAYTASHSIPFLLLTTIFLFVYAVAGMALLGGKLHEPDPVTGRPVPTRANFDSFYWSVISVFQIICLDNWNSSMYQAMAWSSPFLSALFYASAVLLGKYLLLNLLVAILVENYSFVQSEEMERKMTRYKSQKSSTNNMQTPFEFLRHKFKHEESEKKHTLTQQRSMESTTAEAPAATLFEVVQRLRTSGASLARQSSVALAPYLSRRSSSNLTAKRSVSNLSAKSLEPSASKPEPGSVPFSPSGVSIGQNNPPGPTNTPTSTLRAPLKFEAQATQAGVHRGTSASEQEHWSDEDIEAGGGRRDREGRSDSVTSLAPCCPTACTKHPTMLRLRQLAAQLDKACLRVYEHEYFPLAMVVVVILSCMLLSLDSPGLGGQGPGHKSRVILSISEAITIAILTFEQVYRVRSLGGVLTYDGSYLTRLWDWTDLLLLLSALVALCLPYGGHAAQTAKVIRALRPVTLIPRVNGLMVVVNTLYQALRSCSSVIFVASVFYLVFAILGVNLFGGAFYRCTDPERTCVQTLGHGTVEDCPITLACSGRFYDVQTGALQARQWINPRFSPSGTPYSFDHVGAALLTLFEVASLDMWSTIMFSAVDVVGPGHAPSRNANKYAALYFLCFLFIVCFFVQEIFVAVIIDNFKKIRQISNGSAFMTSQQREWVRLQKALKFQQPRIRATPPANQPLRKQAYHAVTHKSFEWVVLVAICLNVIFMLSDHWGQTAQWQEGLVCMDHFFTLVYVCEAVLRVLAMGWATYFMSRWNRYDLFVTLYGVAMLCLGPMAYRLFFLSLLLHLSRALRIFRVIRVSSRLQRLVRTFYLSLPSLQNIGMFLLLILYIYAGIGTHLFSEVPLTGDFITENANFSSFPLAFLTLIRMVTGENWNGLMHEVDSHSSRATTYFCSFIILMSYVMLNLFIATMLENFQEDMGQLVVTTKDIRGFSRSWTEVKKKSLRGDLSKIDNTTTKVTTPVMRSQQQRMSFRMSSSTAELLASAGRSARQSVGRPFRLLHQMSSSLGHSGGKGGKKKGADGKGKKRKKSLDGKGAAAQGGGEKEKTEAFFAQEEASIFLRLYESSPRYLPIQFLKPFLVGLPAPLGPKPCLQPGEGLTSTRVLEYMRSLEVPVNRFAYVYYQDVLQAVLRRAFEVQTCIPQTLRLPFKNKRVFLAHEWYAAVAVQSTWRGRSLRRKLSSQGSSTSLSDTVTTPSTTLTGLFASTGPTHPHPLRRHASEHDKDKGKDKRQPPSGGQGRRKAGLSPLTLPSPQTPLEGGGGAPSVPFLSTPGRPHSPLPVASPPPLLLPTPVTRTLAYDGPLTSAPPDDTDSHRDRDRDREKDKGRRSRHASSAHAIATSPPAAPKQPQQQQREQEEEEEGGSGPAPDDAVVIAVAEGTTPITPTPASASASAVSPSHSHDVAHSSVTVTVAHAAIDLSLSPAVETDALLSDEDEEEEDEEEEDEEEEEEEEGEEEVPDWEAIREAQLVAQELQRVVEQDLSTLYATHGPGLLQGERMLDLEMTEEADREEEVERRSRSLRRSPLSPYNFLSPRRSPANSHSRGPTPPHSPGTRSSRTPSHAPSASASRPLSLSPRSPTRRTPRAGVSRRDDDQQETESLI